MNRMPAPGQDSGAGPASPRVSTLRQLNPKPAALEKLLRYDDGVRRDWLRWYELNGKPSPLALKLASP